MNESSISASVNSLDNARTSMVEGIVLVQASFVVPFLASQSAAHLSS